MRKAGRSGFGLVVDTPCRQSKSADVGVCVVRVGGSSGSCSCVFEQTVGQSWHAACLLFDENGVCL